MSRRLQSQGFLVTLDYLGEPVTTSDESVAATLEYVRLMDVIADSGIERNISVKMTRRGIGVDRATCVDNMRRLLEPAARRASLSALTWRTRPTRNGRSRSSKRCRSTSIERLA